MRRRRGHRTPRRIREWRIIRVLARDVWLRVILLGGFLVGLVGLLLVVRIWNVAPSGSAEKIRISLVDMVQAWNLSRTARRLELAGDDEGALRSRGAAIANHPTRPELSRSYLETALRLPEDRDRLSRAAAQAAAALPLSRRSNANSRPRLNTGSRSAKWPPPSETRSCWPGPPRGCMPWTPTT